MADIPVYRVVNLAVTDADADYQALSEYRRAGTRLELLLLVHGMPPGG